jgi:hypothetical protein
MSIKIYLTAIIRQKTGCHIPEISDAILEILYNEYSKTNSEKICKGIKLLNEYAENKDIWSVKHEVFPATHLVECSLNRDLEGCIMRDGLIQDYKLWDENSFVADAPIYNNDVLQISAYDDYFNNVQDDLKKGYKKLHYYSWHKDSRKGKKEDKYIGLGFYYLFIWEREIIKRFKEENTDYQTFLAELKFGNYTEYDNIYEFGMINTLALMNMYDDYVEVFNGGEGWKLYDKNDNLNDPVKNTKTGDIKTLGKVFIIYRNEAYKEYLKNGGDRYNDFNNYEQLDNDYLRTNEDYYIHRQPVPKHIR